VSDNMSPRYHALTLATLIERLTQLPAHLPIRTDGGQKIAGVERLAEDVAVLRLLAQPHAAHPDFDPAWRIS